MAYISAVLAVVAAGISAYTAYEAKQTQAEVADYNAKVARNRAQAAIQAGQVNARAVRRQNERILARQRALYGSAGVDIGEGSPLLVQLDSAVEGELNALNALYRGQVEGTAALGEADYQAWVRRTSRRQALPSAFLSGVSSGVATYAGMGGFRGSNTLLSPGAGGGGGGAGAGGGSAPGLGLASTGGGGWGYA